MTEKNSEDLLSNIGSFQIYITTLLTTTFFIGYIFYGITTGIYNTAVMGLIYSFIFCGCGLFILFLMTSNKGLCSEPTMVAAGQAFYFPFTIVFMLGVVLLNMFPGWVRGFSNTFGTLIANMLGFRGYIIKNNLLKEHNSDMNEITKQLVMKIEKDPSVLFNEISPDDFKKEINESGTTIYWNSLEQLKHLLNESALYENGKLNQKHATSLFTFIYIKNMVGYFIWYLLLSLITILISINNLLNSTECTKNTIENKNFKEFITKYSKQKS